MNQSICVRYLALLCVINHDIADSDCISLHPITVRLTLGNDNRKNFGSILPRGSNWEKIIIHRGFMYSN